VDDPDIEGEPELLSIEAVCRPEILGDTLSLAIIDIVCETDELGRLDALDSIEGDNRPDTVDSTETVAISDTLYCPDELSVFVLLLELEAQADGEILDTCDGHGSPDIVGVRVGLLESEGETEAVGNTELLVITDIVGILDALDTIVVVTDSD
jgi:hypothetical protein